MFWYNDTSQPCMKQHNSDQQLNWENIHFPLCKTSPCPAGHCAHGMAAFVLLLAPAKNPNELAIPSLRCDKWFGKDTLLGFFARRKFCSIAQPKLQLYVHGRQLGGQISENIRHCDSLHPFACFAGLARKVLRRFHSGEPKHLALGFLLSFGFDYRCCQ